MAALLSPVAAAGPPAMAQGTPPQPEGGEQAAIVTIVFDASGSMWGKLPGDRQAKVILARRAIATALTGLPPQTRIGLVAFGHRRQGCTDVQTLHAPSAAGAEAVTEHLDELNPRGRGPVTLALRHAAEGLPAGPGPARLVLVHDDLDNCGQDTCSIVGALREARQGLVVDVVSIGLKREDAERIRCLPQGTGGRHLLATSGEEIEAAIRQALAAAPRAAPRSPPPAARGPGLAAPAAAVGPVIVAPPAHVSGLQITAHLGQSPLTVDLPVRWRIERLAAGSDGLPAVRHGSTQWLPLPPGRYRIEGALDGLSSVREIEVEPDRPTLAAVSFAAGLVEPAGPSEPLGAVGELRLAARRIDGPASPPAGMARDWIALGPRPSLVLPPGRYQIDIRRGPAQSTETIDLKAGERRQVAAAPALGYLELAAVARSGEPPFDRVLFSIQVDDPQAPGGRREITRSAEPSPRLGLPAGTYTVTARRGSAEVRERIAVGAGEVVRRQIVLPAGELQLVLAEEASGALRIRPPEVRWRVMAAGAGDGPAVVAYSDRSQLVLPAGTYHVEGRFGRANARATSEVTVLAGGRVTARLSPRAGRVTLRLGPSRAGGAPSEALWQVRDRTGSLVWTAVEAEASGLLQEGTYAVEVQTRAGRRSVAIEVRSGDNRVIEIAPPGQPPH